MTEKELARFNRGNQIKENIKSINRTIEAASNESHKFLEIRVVGSMGSYVGSALTEDNVIRERFINLLTERIKILETEFNNL